MGIHIKHNAPIKLDFLKLREYGLVETMNLIDLMNMLDFKSWASLHEIRDFLSRRVSGHE